MPLQAVEKSMITRALKHNQSFERFFFDFMDIIDRIFFHTLFLMINWIQTKMMCAMYSLLFVIAESKLKKRIRYDDDERSSDRTIRLTRQFLQENAIYLDIIPIFSTSSIIVQIWSILPAEFRWHIVCCMSQWNFHRYNPWLAMNNNDNWACLVAINV